MFPLTIKELATKKEPTDGIDAHGKARCAKLGHEMCGVVL